MLGDSCETETLTLPQHADIVVRGKQSDVPTSKPERTTTLGFHSCPHHCYTYLHTVWEHFLSIEPFFLFTKLNTSMSVLLMLKWTYSNFVSVASTCIISFFLKLLKRFKTFLILRASLNQCWAVEVEVLDAIKISFKGKVGHNCSLAAGL